MGARESIEPGYRAIWQAVLRNVDLMPESRLEDTPEGLDTRSFRAIALHIANSSVMFGENIGKSVWERIAPFDQDAYRSKARVLEAVREGGERYLAGLARLTDQEAGRIAEAPFGAKLPQAALAGMQVPHAFYHNGQLSIYLRMAGIKPVFAVLQPPAK